MIAPLQYHLPQIQMLWNDPWWTLVALKMIPGDPQLHQKWSLVIPSGRQNDPWSPPVAPRMILDEP